MDIKRTDNEKFDKEINYYTKKERKREKNKKCCF